MKIFKGNNLVELMIEKTNFLSIRYKKYANFKYLIGETQKI